MEMENRSSNKNPREKHYMKISQLVHQSGVNKTTIHYYLNIGLLPPPLRRGLNLQLYDQTHLACLREIKRLRSKENLSLKEIKEILSNKDWDSIAAGSALLNGNKSSGNLPEKRNGEDVIKRRQLLEKAALLFSQYGYESVRISDIADALHMGKSTFYVYFKSKEDIFMACIDKLSLWAVPEDEWSDIIKEKNFFKKMLKRIKAFLKAFNKYSGMLSIAKQHSRSDNKNIALQAQNAINVLAKALEKDILRAQNNGVIRKINADIVSHFILSMAESLGHRLLMDSQYSMDDALSVLDDFLKHGLALKKRQKKE